MCSAVTRRFAVIGFTLALASFLAAGCDEDASPTTPAPAPPLPAPPPPPPEDPERPPIRAEEVVDRETLRLFVEAAVEAASAGISSEDEIYSFFDTTFRPEGQWRHGEVYLGAIEPNGTSFFNAAFPEIEGTDISDLTDLNGVRITEALLAASTAGGGYVEYLWPNPAVEGDEETGSPKVSYGVLATLGGRELSIGAGIYPPVTAADVRNRGTLKSFVDRAAAELEANASDLETAYAFLDADFRPEGEWRHGGVYMFLHTMELISFFNAVNPGIEGLDRSDLEDVNGVKITQEFRAAAVAGGGFIEYWYDNPVVEGDEETGSPKVSYATSVTIGSVPMLMGSGFYLDESGENGSRAGSGSGEPTKDPAGEPGSAADATGEECVPTMRV